ncbi:hypothetical protein Ahy_B10g105797 [Arachis hypogaea]|uniref:Uncharacterized protein n=1 Tax=Arachis hypogaea TaxID=3818 RepID=A0A444X8V7_ARAHY|nr:hypothetical protein Ahy_B10g105797 [Arachis hypogaea]
MQGSSSMSSSSIDALTPPCHCGVKFYGCFGYGTSRRCSFFQWYDPEPPARYSDVIRKLLETNEGIRSENIKLKKSRQELLDEVRCLQQCVHQTTSEIEAAVAASMTMEDNMLASVTTTRRRGIAIVALISVIVFVGCFSDQSRQLRRGVVCIGTVFSI